MMASEESLRGGGDGGDTSTYRTGGDSTYKSVVAEVPSTIDPFSPDAHPIVSPASGMESFFISPELRTNNVSAFALASKIRSNNSRGSGSVRSGTSTIATDDFASACEDQEHMPPEPDRSLFGKDILIITNNNPVIPEDEEDELSDDEQDTMANKKNSKKTTPKTTTTPPTDDDGVNATQVVYEKVKDVWTWGKGVPVVGFFEGAAETVATKVIGAVAGGKTISELDGDIKPHLAGFDTTYLNPAITALVAFLTTTAGKADSTLKPILEAMAKPLKMIKSDKKEMTPTSSSPELTTAPVSVN